MAIFTPETQSVFANDIRQAWQSPHFYVSFAGTVIYLGCLLLAARVGPRVRARDAYVVGASIMLSAIPLYVVGADYGRWLSVSALIAVLVITNTQLMETVSSWLPSRSPAAGDTTTLPTSGRLTAFAFTAVAAILTPFLFLPHYPPSFLVIRMLSAKTWGLDDFRALVSALLSG
jgi:hypothetical protein